MAFPRSSRKLTYGSTKPIEQPMVIEDEGNATRVVKTSLTMGLGDNAERHLSKPIFVIKLGDDQPLPNTISLIDKKKLSPTKSKFKNVVILVVGSLQRYFFWNFTAALNDQQMVELLKDIPSLPLNLEMLAAWLPTRLHTHAKLIEQEYIDNKTREFDFETFKASFISYDEIVVMPSPNSYQECINRVSEEYTREGSALRTAYDNTAIALVNSQRSQILREVSRITHLRSDVLSQLTADAWLKVAHFCCVRYLIEECTLLSYGLVANGYTSILSPVVSTEAFKVTRSLLLTPEKSISWIFLNHQRLDKDYSVSDQVNIQSNPHRRSNTNSSKVISSFLNRNPAPRKLSMLITDPSTDTNSQNDSGPMTPIAEELGSNMNTTDDGSDPEFENEPTTNTQTTEEADSSQEEYKDDESYNTPRRPFY